MEFVLDEVWPSACGFIIKDWPELVLFFIAFICYRMYQQERKLNAAILDMCKVCNLTLEANQRLIGYLDEAMSVQSEDQEDFATEGS